MVKTGDFIKIIVSNRSKDEPQNVSLFNKKYNNGNVLIEAHCYSPDSSDVKEIGYQKFLDILSENKFHSGKLRITSSHSVLNSGMFSNGIQLLHKAKDFILSRIFYPLFYFKSNQLVNNQVDIIDTEDLSGNCMSIDITPDDHLNFFIDAGQDVSFTFHVSEIENKENIKEKRILSVVLNNDSDDEEGEEYEAIELFKSPLCKVLNSSCEQVLAENESGKPLLFSSLTIITNNESNFDKAGIQVNNEVISPFDYSSSGDHKGVYNIENIKWSSLDKIIVSVKRKTKINLLFEVN